MTKEVNEVLKRIEERLETFENIINETRAKIDYIERDFNGHIKKVRFYMDQMNKLKDVNIISKIFDILYDIEKIAEKLNSLETTTADTNEVSLEGLVSDELEKVEQFVF